MKKYRNGGAFLLALAFALNAASILRTGAGNAGLDWSGLIPSAQARGGGGGHGGGFGGGFGGYGGRGWGGGGEYYGGYGGGGREDGGGMDRGYGGDRDVVDRGYVGDRGDSGNHDDHGDNSVSRFDQAKADAYGRAYNNRVEGLSTDGGFGRLSTEYAGTAQGRNYGGGRALTAASMLSHGDDVRDNWNHRALPLFDHGWWNRHNDWWGYGGWGAGWWGGVGWGDLGGYWGMGDAAEPVEYDYGNNITYNGDQVYYGTQPTATVEQYYDQAQTLATSAPPVQTTVVNGLTQFTGDWKPLGVFSLTQPGNSNPNMIFQLAVNKAGVVSGNYYNTVNNQATPVHGKVDKKNMRVAFTVGKNKNVVYDTGLANLLQPQSSILVHLSKTKTEQDMLVKLNQPKQNGDKSASNG